MLRTFLYSVTLAATVGMLAACDSTSESDQPVADTSQTAANRGTAAEASAPQAEGTGWRIVRVDTNVGEKVAPVFYWKDGTGTEHSLAEYRGKVILLNFWATWCPPCKVELPDIIRLRDEWKDQGFEVLGVSVGEHTPPSGTIQQYLNDFAEKNGMEYPILLGNDELLAAYGGIPAVPTTFVLDREGKIVSRVQGLQTEEAFRSLVEPTLKAGS